MSTNSAQPGTTNPTETHADVDQFPVAKEPHTVRLHRVIKCTPERLFRALTDPRALVKWMAPHGFVAAVHAMDFRVGGSYRMSFSNLNTGHAESFGGIYTTIIPNQRLEYTDKFDDPSMPGTISVAIALRPVLCGTELVIVQSNLPPQIPVEMCYLAWQQSLNQLADLAEAEIS